MQSAGNSIFINCTHLYITNHVKFNHLITFVIDKWFRYDILEWSGVLQITNLIL